MIKNIRELEEYLNISNDPPEGSLECFNELIDKLEKQQEEIKELKEDNKSYKYILDMQNKREYRSKFLKDFQKENGKNMLPDYDEIYKRYDKQKEEIEYYKSELEKESSIWTKIEKGNDYISKDKIRDKVKELEWYGEYIKYRFVYTDYDKEVNKIKIEVLKELLED